MFLTPTRIKGEVSSKGGRIQGETKPDSYTGRSSDRSLPYTGRRRSGSYSGRDETRPVYRENDQSLPYTGRDKRSDTYAKSVPDRTQVSISRRHHCNRRQHSPLLMSRLERSGDGHLVSTVLYLVYCFFNRA